MHVLGVGMIKENASENLAQLLANGTSGKSL